MGHGGQPTVSVEHAILPPLVGRVRAPVHLVAKDEKQAQEWASPDRHGRGQKAQGAEPQMVTARTPLYSRHVVCRLSSHPNKNSGSPAAAHTSRVAAPILRCLPCCFIPHAR